MAGGNSVVQIALTTDFLVLASFENMPRSKVRQQSIEGEAMNVASSGIMKTEPATSGGVVAAGAYVEGRRVANISIDDASSWRSKPDHVVWIGLHEPDMSVLTRVQRQFELHDLAIEDADHAHQRPKIEQYGDALFIVARTAQLDGDSIAFGETHLFVGEGYIVSVRHGASTSYKPVRERCESCPRALARGEDYILYAILDFIVDNYSPAWKPFRRRSKRWKRKCSPAP
jgi:magnesium transporter